MERTDRADILRLLWSTGGQTSSELHSKEGEIVKVTSVGEPDHARRIFTGAEISVDGVVMRGDVLFGPQYSSAVSPYAILQVTASPCEVLLRLDGRRITQLELPIPERVEDRLNSLKEGSRRNECAYELAAMESVKRSRLLEHLALERLERKCADIMKVFHDTQQDWPQTFHIMLFRAMGGNRNREPYMKLASLATYPMVLRERSSVTMVESLLLGTSGLLEGCYYDDYIHSLRNHYEYLQSKYSLQPMHAYEWESIQGYAAGGVIIRIVQLASFLAGSDFLFDCVMSCRTREDIHALFSAEASGYWTTHYRPDERTREFPKRLGTTKSDLLGINLVIPVMFAFGNYTGKEILKEAAVSLYYLLPAEKNKIVNDWTGKDVPLNNSMDAQAVLQLHNEYCLSQRCTVCPIGRASLKKCIKSTPEMTLAI